MDASRQMVSGRDQYHSNKNGDQPYDLIDLAGIRTLVDNPPSVEKAQAQWLIPSTLATRVFREQEEDGEFHLLWADLDKDAPPLDAVAEFLDATIGGADYEIYNSRRASPENPKSRILIPILEPLSGADWIAAQTLLADRLTAAGITPDLAALRPGQICYLPNRGQFYDSRSRRDGNLFDPLTVWSCEIAAIKAQVAAEQAAIAAEREAKRQHREALRATDTQNPDLIGAFNAAFSVVDILIQAGYHQRGKTFLHPNSTSGSYSASVKDGRVHALGQNDPLYTGGQGGGAHDAFSAFQVLFHQGDQTAALKDAGDQWLTIGGESWNKVKQREYMREKSQQHAGARPDKAQANIIDIIDPATGKPKSQATILIEIGGQFLMFHDADRNAYAIVPRNGAREVWPIRSIGFRHILAGEFFTLTGRGFNRNSAADALDTLEAKAVHTGRQQAVYLRVARLDGAIYLDLCDEGWRVIEVKPDGWRILDRSPVHFIRKKGMLPLPVPAGAGDLGRLAKLINMDIEAGHLELIVGWMLGALRGRSPYPILVLQGEQGTGKSSGSRIIRRFIDPSTVPLRAPPKDPRDLIVSAVNNHLVCLDNLSGITPEISDCLCRFATGGGLDLRKLYTDDETVMIDIQRPTMANGIDDICHRPDLAERAVILHLGTLDQTSCVTESKLWEEVDKHSPAIMAGLLDALSAALANEATTHLPRKPRMADFAVWVSAAESATPWPSGGFMAAYQAMRGRAVEEGIDASPVGSVLVEYLRGRSPVMDWSPSATGMYQTLTNVAGDRARSPAWPRTPRGMGQSIHRIAPNLRAIGISYTRDDNHDRLYRFVVDDTGQSANNPPHLPHPPHPSNGAGSGRGRTGADASTGADRSAPAQPSAPPSAPPKPSNGAGSGERGRRGKTFDDCTRTTTDNTLEGDRI